VQIPSEYTCNLAKCHGGNLSAENRLGAHSIPRFKSSLNNNSSLG
jgi:hypothetical protein